MVAVPEAGDLRTALGPQYLHRRRRRRLGRLMFEPVDNDVESFREVAKSSIFNDQE